VIRSYISANVHDTNKFDRPVITTREGVHGDKSIQARSESESFVRRVYFVEYWKEVLKHAFESETEQVEQEIFR